MLIILRSTFLQSRAFAFIFLLPTALMMQGSALAQWTGTTDIYKTTTGNVGIGMYTPNNRLTIMGAGQNDGVWVTSNGGSAPDAASGGLVIGPWTLSNKGMRITSDGNLLIGQATQVNTTYKLDIAGSARQISWWSTATGRTMCSIPATG